MVSHLVGPIGGVARLLGVLDGTWSDFRVMSIGVFYRGVVTLLGGACWGRGHISGWSLLGLWLDFWVSY